MRKKTYLTKQGLLEARAEIDHLTRLYKPGLLRTLEEIYTEKNLAEDALYDRAKNDLSSVERRITELEELINSATVVERGNNKRVSVGSKIILKFLPDNKTKTYYVVGTHEADPFKNRISNESPIVQAILGKKVNETATVSLGLKEFNVKILRIFA